MWRGGIPALRNARRGSFPSASAETRPVFARYPRNSRPESARSAEESLMPLAAEGTKVSRIEDCANGMMIYAWSNTIGGSPSGKDARQRGDRVRRSRSRGTMPRSGGWIAKHLSLRAPGMCDSRYPTCSREMWTTFFRTKLQERSIQELIIH